MSLKIELKNLGILKHAEFSLGDLTLICGENNTGKTYADLCTVRFLTTLGVSTSSFSGEAMIMIQNLLAGHCYED